jgi:glycosyltransferase involved in cell wall biosynthesis
MCLDSIRQQSPGPFEVVVVDNGSTDGTRETIDSYARVMPIVYAFVGEPSIPRSRNTALARASGDAGLFIDDDCLAEPGWLAEAAHALEVHADAHMIQGAVRSRARTIVGRALAVSSEAYFDEFYFSDRARTKLRYVWTSNLLIRLLDRTPVRFDESLIRSSDRELGARAVAEGAVIAYHPALSVMHDYDGRPFGSLLARFFLNARFGDPSVSVQRLVGAVARNLRNQPALKGAAAFAAALAFIGAGAAGSAYWRTRSILAGRP